MPMGKFNEYLMSYRKSALFFSACCIAILLAPNFYITDSKAIQLSEQVALAIGFWLAWFAVFKRLWLSVAMATLFIRLAPFSLYLRHQYAIPINPILIGTVLDSNLQEIINFIASYGSYLIPATTFAILIGFAAIYCAYIAKLSWEHRSRWWILFILPVYFLVVFYESVALDTSKFIGQLHPLNTTDQTIMSEKLKLIFPLDIGFSIQDFMQSTTLMKSMRHSLQNYRFNAYFDKGMELSPDVVVLIIGESARADKWHLFGYERQTTPYLETQENLIGFSDVITPSVATRYAVPNLVSRKPIFNADGTVNKKVQPSFLKAFSEVGYRTYWLSNQSKSGFYDSPIDFYAEDADVVKYVNISSYSFLGNYDESLLKPFYHFLGKDKKAVFVLHLMGSHFNYAYRYPATFDHFKPSIMGSVYAEIRSKEDMAVSAKLLTNNSYDNSIIYTDFILSSIINKIKEKNKSAVVAYISDHGEDIYEADCAIPTLSRVSAVSYHVPAFIWMSKEQVRNNQQTYALLKERANAPIESSLFSNSLVAIAGIKVDDQHESLLSEKMPKIPRMVFGQSNWIDYDEAKKKNACKIN